VSFRVVLGGFGSMVRRVSVVSVSYVRVVGCCFVIASFMMASSFAMVVGRALVMLGSLAVMMRRFLRHGVFLSLEWFRIRNSDSVEHCWRR
jgi:hypothetical protein